MNRQRILCLWMPVWPVQRRIMEDSSLAGQAIAVHHAMARQGRRLLACSRSARQLGLAPEMPLADAASMRRRRSAPLHLHAHDAAADLRQLATLAEHCERFSPLVGWRTTDDKDMAPVGGPDCLFLDVTLVAKHFGGEPELVRRACEALGRRGLHPLAGLGPTIGAAWAAARYAQDGGDAAPGHRWLLPHSATDLESCLQSLPPFALRLPEDALELLRQLGICTLGQLRELPRAAVAARLGEAPGRRYDQLIGAAEEAILAHRPAPQFCVERRFEAPVRERRAVAAAVTELTSLLSEQLKSARRGATEVVCRLDSLSGQTTKQRLGLFEPSWDTDHIGDLLRLQLESAQLENGVERATLMATKVAPMEARQGDLFGAVEDTILAAQLVDRLRQRLGEKQVVAPQLRADAQPERAVAYVTRALRKKTRQASQTRKANDTRQATPPTLCRPLTLAEPQELTVFSWQDELPLEFSWNGRLVERRRCWGPERIETGWWRGKSVRRDYYRVELRTGERLWIFCQLNAKQWYLHGWYC